jgi:hypothetical protein
MGPQPPPSEPSDGPDRDSAGVTATDPDRGWTVLGELRPDGRIAATGTGGPRSHCPRVLSQRDG